MKKTCVQIAVVLGLVLFAVTGRGADALLSSLNNPQGKLVSDYANLFPTQQVVELEGFLQDVKNKTTAEIAVVTLPSLDGGEISDFATRLFEKWGIGKKGKDNGILLLMALQDRKTRIEVGYGLEGLIPDARAGQILDENVIPFFKEGKFSDGLINGAHAIGLIVAKDAGVSMTGTVVAVQAPVASSTGGSTPVGAFIFMGFVAALILLGVWAKKTGRISSGGGGSSSGGSGGSSGGSSSSGGFGGGSSGGGGAGRSW